MRSLKTNDEIVNESTKYREKLNIERVYSKQQEIFFNNFNSL